MWPDPTDTSKRKPRYLLGTPANKYYYMLSIGIISVTFACLNLALYIPHFQKKINNTIEKIKEQEENREFREFMLDPLVKSAITSKKESYEKKPDWVEMR